MIWGYVFAVVLGLTAIAVWRSQLHRHCVYALASWQLLIKASYEKGVIETEGTLIAAAVFMIMCVAISVYHHDKFPYQLLLVGGLLAVWAGLHHVTGWDDAYRFKAVRNILYSMGCLLCFMNYRRASLP